MPSHGLILQSLAAVPSVGMSLLIMVVLIAIFAASWMMFWALVERSTEQRHRVAMVDWGRERGFRFRVIGADDAPPPPLDAIAGQRLAIHVFLSGKRTKFIQVETIAPIGDRAAGEVAPPAGTWNLLIREIDPPWPPTGLRPVSATASAVDLFSMTSFPLLGGSERFVIYGTDSIAAAALSKSSARGLLPPDIGLLLHGRHVVLDFSNRPFDTVEFERMIAVVDQVVNHLPSPG